MGSNTPIEIKPGYIVVIEYRRLTKVDKTKQETIALLKEDGSLYFANSNFSCDYKKEDCNNGLFFTQDGYEYTITMIWGNPSEACDFRLSKEYRKIIYDANKQKMTKNQIEKIIGHQIEIVEE